MAQGGRHGRRKVRYQGGDAAGLDQRSNDAIDVRQRHQATQRGLFDRIRVITTAVPVCMIVLSVELKNSMSTAVVSSIITHNVLDTVNTYMTSTALKPSLKL